MNSSSCTQHRLMSGHKLDICPWNVNREWDIPRFSDLTCRSSGGTCGNRENWHSNRGSIESTENASSPLAGEYHEAGGVFNAQFQAF